MKNEQTKNLVMTAILTALVVVLTYVVPPIPGLNAKITLTLVPIVIGAAFGGVKSGAWLGFVFGVCVLIDPSTGVFLSINALGTVAICLVKGTLCGVAAALIYKWLSGFNKYVAVALASVICPLVNTGIFLIGARIFYMDWIIGLAGNGNPIVFMFVGLAGINFLIEVGTNVILNPAIVRLLKVAEK